MKHLTFTLLTFILIAVTAQAQTVQIMPETNRATVPYFDANINTFGAGGQINALTFGAEYHRKFGQPGLFLKARVAPVLVEAFGIQVISGVSGSAGYFVEGVRGTKTNWAAVYGLRIPKWRLEFTRQHVYHFGDDYIIPVSVRWYLD